MILITNLKKKMANGMKETLNQLDFMSKEKVCIMKSIRQP